MSMKTMAHRDGLLIVWFVVALVLGGCDSNHTSLSNDTSASQAPGEWTGTITVYAHQYTPNARGAQTPLRALREAADEYESMHPGVEIEFVDEQFQQYNNVVRVKAAAGELWDVYWAQWSALNNALPAGIAVDLAPYFGEKNPYLPGVSTWQEAMNTTIVNETKASGGASYNINGDYVATAFFYNKDLFARSGVAALPRSWSELLQASEQLRRAGIPAVVGVPQYDWWQRFFLTDFYARDYQRIAAYDGAPGISARDEAAAISGSVLSTRDQRFMAWWPLFREFARYWVPDYLVQDPEADYAALQDFIGGRAAMYYSGSWLPRQLRNARVSFEWGTFDFPGLTQSESAYSNNQNVAGAVGGPNAGYQFAVSTPRANRTMREPGKQAAVLDWLRYIGTPAVAERVINEEGSFIPSWAGTKPIREFDRLTTHVSRQPGIVWVGNSSPQLGPEMQMIFGLYLSGNISLEQATTEAQEALDAAAADYRRRGKP